MKMNSFLFHLSLRGLGVLNFKNSKVSGERVFLQRYLKSKSGVVIDVGANEGSYTEEAIRVNSKLNVYAFEPHPKTFERLVEKLSPYENVKCINKGLSDSVGDLVLYDYFDEMGSSHASLYEDVITGIHRAKKLSRVKVGLTTIDSFIQEQGIDRVELLKIDTEGNEFAVLSGAKGALASKKIMAIHFEFNEMNVVSGSFFRDFYVMLSDYDIYRLLPNEMLKIDDYKPLSCEIFAYQNIVALLRV